MANRALRQPLSLKIASNGFLAFWCFVAAFPIVWIGFMSFKTPLDAFDSNPFRVMFGPHTRDNVGGLSIVDIALGIALIWFLIRTAIRWLPRQVEEFAPTGNKVFPWLIGGGAYALGALILLVVVLPVVSGVLNPLLGPLGRDVIGLTTEHYEAVWVDRGFGRNFVNSMVVTLGVVTVSLT